MDEIVGNQAETFTFGRKRRKSQTLARILEHSYATHARVKVFGSRGEVGHFMFSFFVKVKEALALQTFYRNEVITFHKSRAKKKKGLSALF